MTNNSELDRLRPLVGKWVVTKNKNINTTHRMFLVGFDVQGRPVTSNDGSALNALVEMEPIISEWTEPKKIKYEWQMVFCDDGYCFKINEYDRELFKIGDDMGGPESPRKIIAIKEYTEEI